MKLRWPGSRRSRRGDPILDSPIVCATSSITVTSSLTDEEEITRGHIDNVERRVRDVLMTDAFFHSFCSNPQGITTPESRSTRSSRESMGLSASDETHAHPPGRLRLESADHYGGRQMRAAYAVPGGERVEVCSGWGITAEMQLPLGAADVEVSFATQAGHPVYKVDRRRRWQWVRSPGGDLTPDRFQFACGDGVDCCFRLAGKPDRSFVKRAWDHGRAFTGRPPAAWEWWDDGAAPPRRQCDDAALDELCGPATHLSPAAAAPPAPPQTPQTPPVPLPVRFSPGDRVQLVTSKPHGCLAGPEIGTVKKVARAGGRVWVKVRGPRGGFAEYQPFELCTPGTFFQVLCAEEEQSRAELDELATARAHSLLQCLAVVKVLTPAGRLTLWAGPVTKPGASGSLVALSRSAPRQAQPEDAYGPEWDLVSPRVLTSPRPTVHGSVFCDDELHSCVGSEVGGEDAGVIVTHRVALELASNAGTHVSDSCDEPQPSSSPVPAAAADASPPELPVGMALALTLPDQKDAHCVEFTEWSFLTGGEGVPALASGAALFACCAGACASLTEVERAVIGTFQHMSVFADESEENGVMPFNVHKPSDRDKHIALLSKSMYLLPPGVRLDSITPQMYASLEYQNAIAAKGVTVHRKIKDRNGRPYAGGDTFCVTKPILPVVFSVTVQNRVSVVPAEFLPQLAPLADGLQVTKALLLERTKQDRGQDATKLAKELVLYHQLAGPGGLLVTHVRFTVLTSLPQFARGFVSRIGTAARRELGETVSNTRRWHARNNVA